MKRGKDQRSSVFAIVKERLGSEPSTAPNPPLPSPLAAAPGDAIDVWEVLDQRLDVTLLRPELVNDVEVRIFRLRWGNDYAMIANPRRLIHFQLEVWEAELAQQMDGSRTVGEIIVDRLEGTGDLDATSVTELVILLRNEGFLEPPPMDAKAALAHRLHPHPGIFERLAVFAKTLRVDWTGADRHVRWWYRSILHPLFTPVGAVLTAILAVGGFAAFLVAQSSGRFSIGDANAPLDSLILLILAFVLTYAHELGHALGLVHYDRRIKSAGFMLYFGSPAFFVDASDGLMLQRQARILEAALGPYSEMILAGLASFLLVAFPSAAAAPLIYKFCVLNYFLIFENLIPLLELDGYFILAEAIEVPDLRERSLQFIQHDLWHKLSRRERLTKQELGLGAYAVIGVLFTIFSIYVAIFFWQEIFGNMVAGLWRGGPGSRILLLVLALFLAGPAIRGLIALGRTTARRLRGLWRRLKFRFETSWRVEAAQMIDELPAFKELPEDVLSDLAGRVRLVSLRPGEPVFRQGDRPTAFYVVRRGTLDVQEEDPDTGDTVVLRTVTHGEAFGELGLIHSAPRAATVRSVDDAELFEVDKATFDRLLADSIDAPAFALTLQTMAELRDMPAFAMLSSEGISELLTQGRWITAAPGDVMIQQGTVGDAFYALRSGWADVIRDGQLVGSLGAGSHFGEIALLRDVPRTATVIARTPVRAFRLSREGFDRVVREAFQRGALKLPADKTWQH